MPFLKTELPFIIGVLLYRTLVCYNSEIRVFSMGDCVCAYVYKYLLLDLRLNRRADIY